MKNKIIITISNEDKAAEMTYDQTSSDPIIHFYFISEHNAYYLFSQAFSKSVYHYFRRGRSESEIHSYNQWNRSPRLDKTIEIIPLYISYVKKEAV